MQFNFNKWSVIATVVASSSVLLAFDENKHAYGCSANPLSMKIAGVQFKNEDIVKALTQIALENKICLGVEDLEQTQSKVSLTLDSGPAKKILSSLLPDFVVTSTMGDVLNLKPKKTSASWLDYRLKTFKANRASLSYNNLQLFLFLQDQANHDSGYTGSFPESLTNKNDVGPISEENRSIRELLNLLLARSTEGGMWLTNHLQPRGGSLPQSGPFWTLVPFKGK